MIANPRHIVDYGLLLIGDGEPLNELARPRARPFAHVGESPRR